MCDVVGHGGGWGYSAHSVEAIRFCADADILLGGLGLFGGRGEYTAKIKVSFVFFVFYSFHLFNHLFSIIFKHFFIMAVILELTCFATGVTLYP